MSNMSPCCRRPTLLNTCRSTRTGQTRGRPSSRARAWGRTSGPRWTPASTRATPTGWTRTARVWWITGHTSSLRRTSDTRGRTPWAAVAGGTPARRPAPPSLPSTRASSRPPPASTWAAAPGAIPSTTQYPFRDRARWYRDKTLSMMTLSSFQVGFESKTAGSNLISLSQIKNYAHDRGGPGTGPASSWCCDSGVSLVETTETPMVSLETTETESERQERVITPGGTWGAESDTRVDTTTSTTGRNTGSITGGDTKQDTQGTQTNQRWLSLQPIIVQMILLAKTSVARFNFCHLVQCDVVLQFAY